MISYYISILLISISITSCIELPKPVCTKYSTVVEIGGCSHACPVKLADGTRVLEMQPMLGDRVCVEKHW